MAVGSVLIGKFFHLIWTWPWPRPVQLKTYEKGTIEAKEWNPKVCVHLYVLETLKLSLSCSFMAMTGVISCP